MTREKPNQRGRMKDPSSDDHEVLEAHIEAMAVAFQVLIGCLEDAGALPPGEFGLKLVDYMSADRREGSPLKLALLDRLRRAMLN